MASSGWQQRRAALEKARTARVKRIQQDVQRIAKRETEFSKTLLDDIVPFRLVWNDDAVKKMKDNLPFTFVEKERPVTPEVVPVRADEESDHDIYD
jgi:hypothetical protein